MATAAPPADRSADDDGVPIDRRSHNQRMIDWYNDPENDPEKQKLAARETRLSAENRARRQGVRNRSVEAAERRIAELEDALMSATTCIDGLHNRLRDFSGENADLKLAQKRLEIELADLRLEHSKGIVDLPNPIATARRVN